MAFYKNPAEKQLEQEQLDLQRRQAPTGQSAYSSTTSTPAPSPQAPAEAKTSYIGLDKYRSANRGSGEILANQVADKASKEFDIANTAADSIDTNVDGITADDEFLKGIGSTSGLTAAQEAKLSAIRGFAPKDLDSSAYNSAYTSAYDKAKTYTNRDVQLAALQDIYNSDEIRNKGITYNSSMGSLDANLLADNGDQITKAVDGIAKGVSDKYKAKTTDYNTNKTKAIATTGSSFDKIKKTADEARSKLQDDNFKQLSQMNLGNKATPAGQVVDRAGSDGRYGDVLDDAELGAASKYDNILGGRTFANTDKAYTQTVYRDAPVPNTTPGAPGTLIIDENAPINPDPGPRSPTVSGPPVVPGTVTISPEATATPSAAAPTSGGTGKLDKYKKKQLNSK